MLVGWFSSKTAQPLCHFHVSRLTSVDREGFSCIYDTNTQTTGGICVETDRQQLYTDTPHRASDTEHS
jgi:hypothetical protein